MLTARTNLFVTAAIAMTLHANSFVACRADPNERTIVLEAFVQKSSAPCDAARKYLDELQARRKGLTVVYRDLSIPDAQRRLELIARHFKIQEPAIPTFYLGRRVVSGFTSAETSGAEIERLLTVEVFVRAGCPHCAAAKEYLRTIEPRYPALRFVYRDIVSDGNARKRWEKVCRDAGVTAPGIPTVHAFGQVIVGFETAETSGARIDSLLRSATIAAPTKSARGQETSRFVPERSPPRTEVSGRSRVPLPRQGRIFRADSPATDAAPAPEQEAGGPPPPMAEDLVPGETPEEIPLELPPDVSDASDSIRIPWIGEVSARDVGLPLFTIAVGLVDGFNPCAMWVLILLLTVLVNLQNRWKMLAVAGTFVIVSGVAYFIFMAAWMSFFFLVGYLWWIQASLGAFAVAAGLIHIKDFFAYHKGVSLSIPESAKPGIYQRVHRIVAAPNVTAAILGAIVLAVLVNVVEILCTAGLPAMYTSILTKQGLPAWKCYSYLMLYTLMYMLDDAAMLGVVIVTLSRRRLQEREGRYLKLISGVVILALGLIMLFKPEWLAW